MMPEPYRIKMVEPISLISRSQRERALVDADYNLFQIAAEDVFIDLLTDSGTGAMSARQWAAMMLGDESYAGARSFYLLQDTVSELFGFPFVMPTHQGRAAEHVFFSTLVHEGDVVPSNAHFDTTRANLEWLQARAIDFPSACANEPMNQCSFKGNMNTDRLVALLEKQSERVPFVMMTITNNRAAGQPVSLGNLQKVSEICHQFGKPLILDACRHAENSYFIKERDPQYNRTSIEWITRKTFSLADGMLMSAKKDGLCNIGGFIAVKDEAVYEQIKTILTLTEGFPTYGGLAGRDLSAMAVGLREAIKEDYLTHRIGQIKFLAHQLETRGIEVYHPVGGHAVYVDAGHLLKGTGMEFPGQSLAAALYLEAGIRACDIGSGMFSENGTSPYDLHLELLRLAIPRRTYTESHLLYVAEAFSHIAETIHLVPDLQCTYKPKYLGHFFAKFAPPLTTEALTDSMVMRSELN